MNKNINKD